MPNSNKDLIKTLTFYFVASLKCMLKKLPSDNHQFKKKK